jgi:hypothetical protein
MRGIIGGFAVLPKFVVVATVQVSHAAADLALTPHRTVANL